MLHMISRSELLFCQIRHHLWASDVVGGGREGGGSQILAGVAALTQCVLAQVHGKAHNKGLVVLHSQLQARPACSKAMKPDLCMGIRAHDHWDFITDQAASL